MKVSLFLVNDTDQRIAFKIKTTIRDRYKVTPVKDIINPGGRVYVDILFSQLFSGPNSSLHNNNNSSSPQEQSAFIAEKHKFLVEAVVAPGSDNAIDKMLNLARSKGTIMEARIRCVFNERYLLNPKSSYSDNGSDGGGRRQQQGAFSENLIFDNRNLNLDNPMVFYGVIVFAVLLFYFLFLK